MNLLRGNFHDQVERLVGGGSAGKGRGRQKTAIDLEVETLKMASDADGFGS